MLRSRKIKRPAVGSSMAADSNRYNFIFQIGRELNALDRFIFCGCDLRAEWRRAMEHVRVQLSATAPFSHHWRNKIQRTKRGSRSASPAQASAPNAIENAMGNIPLRAMT
jgi:hypothetical protein